MASACVYLVCSVAALSLAHAARTGPDPAIRVRSSSRPASVSDQQAQDEVVSIPGADLTSRHFAGYIPVSGSSKKLFYYFVESERDPENDPVVLWLNGGPGCSSFDGFVFEQGPWNFILNAKGDAVELAPNPYAWSKVANMIFLDSPAGVGLSYSDDPKDYNTGDMQTAEDADKFLRNWFERFPQYQENAFFISGESYAGIYVPNLARAVVEGNDEGVLPYINIEGYLVGNGCTDYRYDGDALPPFAMGKSLVSRNDYSALVTACNGTFWNRKEGSTCDRQFNDLASALVGLNVYDVLEYCYHGSSGSDANQALLKAYKKHGVKWPLPGASAPLASPGPVLNWGHLGITPPCTDARHAVLWLNNPQVRKAIHAEPLSKIGPFALCSDKIMYTSQIKSTIPIHRRLVEKHGLRALIYSGDHDMAVPHTGSEAWTSQLGYTVSEPWRPWFFEARVGANGAQSGGMQVGGYVVSYEEGLSYATVKGAGHMVPETNPQESLAMFERFLAGTRL